MKRAIVVLSLLVSNVIWAHVTLPSIFSDHMVLQQQTDVKFWGWAGPNEEVEIKPSWTDKIYKTKGNADAKWDIEIKTPAAGTGHTITISGTNQLIIQDVLVGEVWLCSGQSNMEMSASWGITNGETEVKKANHPSIRFFRVERMSAEHPQDHIVGKWEVCTPETMKNNSAVAYFFAQRLQEGLKRTPVGLISSAWGGTPAETWMPEEVILQDSILKKAAKKLKPVEWGPVAPGRVYNAMIHPIIGFTIAGTIWYQGEANVGSNDYESTFSALIQAWRAQWKNDFPFYFVQIAPFNYGNDHTAAVEIREAQRRVSRALDQTGMVVISDVSTIDDIHPKNKKPVGKRLANLALKRHYMHAIGIVESPEIESMSIIKKEAILKFKHAVGLHMVGATSLFEIAGKDGLFHSAELKFKKNSIHLHSSKVSQPKAVRFAWGNTLQSNVFNEAGLPLSSFNLEL